jgi:hypothetical protein
MKDVAEEIMLLRIKLSEAKAIAEYKSELNDEKIFAVKYNEEGKEFYVTIRPFQNEDKLITAYQAGEEIKIIKKSEI